MKIGFDGECAMFNFTGFGNYSRYILEILSKYYPNNEYDLFTTKPRDNKRLDKLLEEYPCLKMVWANSYGKYFPKTWRKRGLTNQLKHSGIELYHGLANELPYNIRKSGIKSVVTIHDLMFLRHPENYSYFVRRKLSNIYSKACNNADQIIAVSEWTKRDIITLFNVPEEKVTTIYQGCDDKFTMPATLERKIAVRDKYHLPERYILNVGRIEKRKNAILAVKAMKKLPREINLVIVGYRTEYTKEIEKYVVDNRLSKRVMILDNVSFADLPAIYQQAELFVYPSIYEGFGIPIVEALNSGIPVISTTDSCLEEAGGPSSMYIKSNDVEALINSATEILYTPSVRKRMSEEGKEYAQRFSADIQAENLMRLYSDLINK